jgi:hypothetical protein
MKTALWRVRIAVFATALAAFAGAAVFWAEMSAALRENPDSYKIEEQQARLAGVAEMLPVDAIVGYISDVPFGKADGQVYFFVTQYVLAPRLVVEETPSRKQRWVVGNFLKRPDVAQIERERGLKLVKYFGRGVYLFERGS